MNGVAALRCSRTGQGGCPKLRERFESVPQKPLKRLPSRCGRKNTRRKSGVNERRGFRQGCSGTGAFRRGLGEAGIQLFLS